MGRRLYLALLAAAAALALLPGLGWGAYPVNEAPFYTQPYLVSPTPHHSMYIIWFTSTPTTESYVEFGPGYGTRVRAATYEIEGFKTTDAQGRYTVPLPVYQQIVHLKGLKPGARYYYRAVSDGVATMGYDFRTAPNPGRPVKFVLLSDLQMKAQVPETVRLAGQQEVDFIIYNGDFGSRNPERSGEWFTVPGQVFPADVNPASTDEIDTHRWFNVMQQWGDGCRLLQYVPIYPTPGNHEIDDQSLLRTPVEGRDRMTMKIYLQLFRPLYPEQEYGPNGRHWYAVDFGDVHLISLSIFRWFAYPAATPPGWYLFDDIQAGSPQYQWLEHDLKTAKNQKYIWITQHWHTLNRGWDVAVPFTDPVIVDGVATYPAENDYLLRDLLPLMEKYGVNAVSYGHSHVYERYEWEYAPGRVIHFIEAASIGNNYRSATDPPASPNTGLIPAFEENRFRSIMVVEVNRGHGMSAQGIQASGDQIGRVFDEFTVAPSLWR